MSDTWLNNAFAIIFLIGLIIIYIPQYHKIIVSRSSLGFSTWFMFLGHTASFLSCLNTLVFYINNWWHCHGSVDCLEDFLGFGLIVIQWFLYWIQYLMFIKYYPEQNHHNHQEPQCKWYQGYQLAKITFIISHLIGLGFLAITLGLLGYHGWHDTNTSDLKGLTEAMEVIILIMFTSHYLPQIWETYQLKKPGSLSLITLGLMTPGSFLWTAFLALQDKMVPGSKSSNPAVWIPYLIVGTFQGVLLAMCLYYDKQEKKLIAGYEKIFDNSCYEIFDEDDILIGTDP